MAHVLIGTMESQWEPERFHDTHRQKVESLIEEKSQGKTIATPKVAPLPKVVDLMEALQASIRATQSEEKKPAAKASRPEAAAKATPTKSAATSKKAPAGKSARRKAS